MITMSCQQSEDDAYHYFFVCKSYEDCRPEVQNINLHNKKDFKFLKNSIKNTKTNLIGTQPPQP